METFYLHVPYVTIWYAYNLAKSTFVHTTIKMRCNNCRKCQGHRKTTGHFQKKGVGGSSMCYEHVRDWDAERSEDEPKSHCKAGLQAASAGTIA